MAYRKIDDNKILAIANAIRAKNGTDDLYSIVQVPSAIDNIKSETGAYNIGMDVAGLSCMTMPNETTPIFRTYYQFYRVAGDVYTQYTSNGSSSGSVTASATGSLYTYSTSNVNNLNRVNCGIVFNNNSNGSYLMRTPTFILEKQRLTYYNEAGTSVINTEYVTFASAATYSGTPAKSSTSQYTYTFDGWSESTNGSVVSLSKILEDKTLYPHYTATVKTYTVKFYNGSTLLYTETTNYGGSVTYGGTATSNLSNPQGRSGYTFWKWDRDTDWITSDTNVYAVFWGTYNYLEITDSWYDVVAACNDGTYKQKYSTGMYKELYTGISGATARVMIMGVDIDYDPYGNSLPLSFGFIDHYLIGYYGDAYVKGYSNSYVKSWIDNYYTYFEYPVCDNVKQIVKYSDYDGVTDMAFCYIWMLNRYELGLGGSYGANYNSSVKTYFRNNMNYLNPDNIEDTFNIHTTHYWLRDCSTVVDPGGERQTVPYIGYYNSSSTSTESASFSNVIPMGFCL